MTIAIGLVVLVGGFLLFPPLGLAAAAAVLLLDVSTATSSAAP